MTAKSSRALVVLTTCASAEEASGLAAALVEQRLAACVNSLANVSSTYRWQGRLQRDEENLLVIKTTEARFAAVEQLIRARSSYELPEVLAVPVQVGSSAYLRWLGAEVEGPSLPTSPADERTEA
jgi:periplasmic divalent cation tolerance protein